MYFVGTSSRWRLCCAQLCASFLSAIRPRVGPGHIPTFLRLSALHTTQMTHPTTTPHALRPLQHTPQVQARQCDWRNREGRSESTGWPVASDAPPSNPPPHHPAPNTVNHHAFTHAGTQHARSLLISRAHRRGLVMPLRAAGEVRVSCSKAVFCCFWREGKKQDFGQL